MLVNLLNYLLPDVHLQMWGSVGNCRCLFEVSNLFPNHNEICDKYYSNSNIFLAWKGSWKYRYVKNELEYYRKVAVHACFASWSILKRFCKKQ